MLTVPAKISNLPFKYTSEASEADVARFTVPPFTDKQEVAGIVNAVVVGVIATALVNLNVPFVRTKAGSVPDNVKAEEVTVNTGVCEVPLLRVSTLKSVVAPAPEMVVLEVPVNVTSQSLPAVLKSTVPALLTSSN